MEDKQERALDLVREALARYTDAPLDSLQPATKLADLEVDSLSLAELLFELEDRVGAAMPDSMTLPQSIQDVVALVLPYISA